MESNIGYILEVVGSVCDVDIDEILSKSRRIPLPMFRGFMWYVIRKATGYSNAHIARITTHNGHTYTGCAVGIAINKAMDLIYAEKYWHNCWEKVAEKLNLSNMANDERMDINVAIFVPKGKKDKVNVNVEINERKK